MRRASILIPAGDFAFYDQMLNMTALLGAVPARFNAPDGGEIDLDHVFRHGERNRRLSRRWK